MVQKLHVRTANRYYLQAAGGGGGDVTASGPWPREWETFELVPAAARFADLTSGAVVHLRTYDRHYVATDPGGKVLATAAAPSSPAQFTLVAADGEPVALGHFSQFGLRDSLGRFLTADGGGGGAVHAGPTVMGSAETFTADFHPEPPEYAATVNLRVASGYVFVQAAGGGGAALGYGPWPREWETFDIVAADREGRGLPDGCKVNVRTDSWHYLQAQNGGGGVVNAAGPWPREWETFTLVVPGRRPWLRSGAKIGLRAMNGQYVGTSAAGFTATATTAGDWQLFTVTDATEVIGAPVRVQSSAYEAELSVTSTSWTRVPGGHVVATRVPSTLSALAVAEFRVQYEGAELLARVAVDGNAVHPPQQVVTARTTWSSHSVMGSHLQGLPAGSHAVDLEIRATRGVVWVRNLAFTVWETRV